MNLSVDGVQTVLGHGHLRSIEDAAVEREKELQLKKKLADTKYAFMTL